MPTVLVSGASRGLGLEFVRQYAADGWSVIATCRDPDKADALAAVKGRIRIERMDSEDEASIAALAARLDGTTIDHLISNAGISSPRPPAGQPHPQSFALTNSEDWLRMLRINLLGPFHLIRAFLPHVAAGQRKVIATVSSRLGSIALNKEGGMYAYRTSKAAVNMMTKSLAADHKATGIAFIVLHPGWVRTDMGGTLAPLAPEHSVANMRQVLDRVTAADSGHFFNHTGEELPW